MDQDAKPRSEVIEESRETLALMELDRTPRPQKLAIERSYFDGAHEIRFTERTFRPKHGANLDDIRAFVDSLEIARLPAPLPGPPLAPAAPAVEPRIPDHYRDPLERAIRGTLVRVETVHRVGTGTVVDVLWEERDEGERRGLFIIEDNEAKPFENVAATVDQLPAPAVPEAKPAEPAEPAPVEAATAPAPVESKRRFGFGRKKEEPAPPSEPDKKRRFGFGKK